MIEANLLLILASTPFAAALVAASMSTGARNGEAWLAGSVMVAGLAILARLYPGIAGGNNVVARVGWLPELGLDLVFRIAGLSWLLTVLVLGTGLFVVTSARSYLSPKDPK